jgi:zinc transport system substrate-binding protein
MVLAGCSRQDESIAAAGAPVVYTVNYPLAYVAERISGDFVDVRFPEMDGDPAFWNPSAEMISTYQDADLVLLNGASYAKWVPKVSLPAAKLVDTSVAFKDRFMPLEGAVTHSHGPGGEHEHGEFAFTTWLDPQLAVQQAAAIRDAFETRLKIDVSAFDGLSEELMQLDAALEQAFAALGDQPLLGSHPVYQYLARRYGLRMESVHWEPDTVPDTVMWRELEDILETHPAKIMLWEGEPLPQTREKLMGKGIECVVFDPCGNRPETGDYLSVMQQNLQALRR